MLDRHEKKIHRSTYKQVYERHMCDSFVRHMSNYLCETSATIMAGTRTILRATRATLSLVTQANYARHTRTTHYQCNIHYKKLARVMTYLHIRKVVSSQRVVSPPFLFADKFSSSLVHNNNCYNCCYCAVWPRGGNIFLAGVLKSQR